ncbi:hypothetical protein [Saccharothrix hoggarensis]|uniref:Uncharacterized protein n=1 Tax=Saccharothrix hoggarensis TaxID=913853 RepID=A0ABW3R196_9PSEU
MHLVPDGGAAVREPGAAAREPAPVAAKPLTSVVAAHRRTRRLLGLAVPGVVAVVLCLGAWSVVPLAVIAVAAIVTFSESSTGASA